jgi:DNA-binding winged helix-turn-helix (wHTH) protein/TolB-like protein/Tfp pilus assembly protein PilF
MNKRIYEFDEFLLDVAEKRLLRNGQAVSLQPKVFDMLAAFVERHGELISRDELMNAVWADTFVEESNLRFCLHGLRKALGKNAKGVEYIETIPKRGYRFTSEIHEKITPIITRQEINLTVEEEAKITAKPKPARRYWLIGLLVVSISGLLILAFIWQKNTIATNENLIGINKIAVLPFETIVENDAEIQIGLADSIIANLSKIESLKVLPTASIRKFIGQDFDPLAVGRELQTEAVLKGSFRIVDKEASVTASLLNVSSGEMVWTETFTVKGNNPTELESSIAIRLSRLLWLRVAEITDEKSLANQNLNPEAVKTYLAARKIWRNGELFRRTEMVSLFEKAIALEPSWALAQSSYAEALLTSDQIFIDWGKAAQIAGKSIELDKSIAQPHTVSAEITHSRDWNWANAESEFKQSITLNPNYAVSYFKYSQFLRLQRRFAEAETSIKKAVEIEPFSPVFYSSLCQLYYYDHKSDKAIEACKYARQIDPDYWLVSKLLFWIYADKKMYAEMEEMVLGKLSPDKRAEHPLTKALAKNDLKLFWQSVIAEPSKEGKTNDIPTSNAMFYLQIGDKEKALKNLELALKIHDDNLPEINADPTFDSIRDEVRFSEIIWKIGLK